MVHHPFPAPDGSELEPCPGTRAGNHVWERVIPGVVTCLRCSMIVCPACQVAFKDSGQADVPCPSCDQLPTDQATG